MRSQLSLVVLPLSALGLGLAACDRSPSEPIVEHAAMHATNARGGDQALRAHGDLLKAVGQQTSRFNSTTQASRAGYVADEHCVTHPQLGGMGDHWVNGGLIDPVFEPMRPEALLYAPGPGGNPRLIAVEYIVIDVGQDRPEFDGQPFDVGGVPPLEATSTPHWSLHVWVHQDNPNGPFAPFNPEVSCG